VAARTAWRLGVPAVLALTGFLLATSAQTARGTDLRAERRTQLTDLIRDREQRVEANVAAVQKLRSEVDQLTSVRGADDQRVAAAQQAASALAVPAGIAALVGPGLTVTLNDAPRSPGVDLPAGVTPDDLVVHQQDVQAVVNALWVGGADAVVVMDQRLLSTSAVRCVGNTLLLNGRVYSPPYQVSAIGDPRRLRAALDSDPSVIVYREWVSAVGLGYRVQDKSTLTAPGYRGTLSLEHARPAA
jgi:uncharacterized protein YlxW (UPF0749 family)